MPLCCFHRLLILSAYGIFIVLFEIGAQKCCRRVCPLKVGQRKADTSGRRRRNWRIDRRCVTNEGHVAAVGRGARGLEPEQVPLRIKAGKLLPFIASMVKIK